MTNETTAEQEQTINPADGKSELNDGLCPGAGNGRHGMKNDSITMNERLTEIFGIPKDAFSATLRMRAGVTPILTVTRMIYRTGQLEPTRKHDRYRLVPVDEVGAGETAPEGHNVELRGRAASGEAPLERRVGGRPS